MTSIEEFYFRYYANRLLREGYIDHQEYQALLAANRLNSSALAEHTAGKHFQFR